MKKYTNYLYLFMSIGLVSLVFSFFTGIELFVLFCEILKNLYFLRITNHGILILLFFITLLGLSFIIFSLFKDLINIYFLLLKNLKVLYIYFFYFCYLFNFSGLNNSLDSFNNFNNFFYFFEGNLSDDYKKKIYEQSELNSKKNISDYELCESWGEIPKKCVNKFNLSRMKLDTYKDYYTKIEKDFKINLNKIKKDPNFSFAENFSKDLTSTFEFMKEHKLNYFKVPGSKFKFSCFKCLSFKYILSSCKSISMFFGFGFFKWFLEYCFFPFNYWFKKLFDIPERLRNQSYWVKIMCETFEIFSNYYRGIWKCNARGSLGSYNFDFWRVLRGTLKSKPFQYNGYISERLDFKEKIGKWYMRKVLYFSKVKNYVLIMDLFSIFKRRNGVREFVFRKFLGETKLVDEGKLSKLDSSRLLKIEIPVYKLLKERDIVDSNSKIQDLDLGKVIPTCSEEDLLTPNPSSRLSHFVLVDICFVGINNWNLKNFVFDTDNFNDWNLKICYTFLYIPCREDFYFRINQYLNRSPYFFSKLGDYRVWLYNFLLFREVRKIFKLSGGAESCVWKICEKHDEKPKIIVKKKLSKVYEK